MKLRSFPFYRCLWWFEQNGWPNEDDVSLDVALRVHGLITDIPDISLDLDGGLERCAYTAMEANIYPIKGVKGK